jgi:hypothetical protein
MNESMILSPCDLILAAHHAVLEEDWDGFAAWG